MRELEHDYEMSLLDTRGSTHGNFRDNARLVQNLKTSMQDSDNWNTLPSYQKEALDMVQHKIGRILTGDSKFLDSWRDIVGYTELVLNELEDDRDASDVRNVKMKKVIGKWKDIS